MKLSSGNAQMCHGVYVMSLLSHGAMENRASLGGRSGYWIGWSVKCTKRRRMKPFAVSLALASIMIRPSLAQLPEDLKRRLDEAERRIVRLPPSAFPELPRNVVRELQRRGCTVPQEAFTKKPHNVIKGGFAKPGQTDWAVLCSVNRTPWPSSLWNDAHYVSSVLVFWNGSEKNPAEIAPADDRNYLQGITATEIGFSRGIRAASRDFIMRHYDAYGGPVPPPIDHQGIDDAFIEKASVTWFFYGGKWLKLTGGGLMVMRSAFAAVLLWFVPVVAGMQATDQPPTQGKHSVVRLSPAAFPELPKNLVTELERRGCTIPQVAGFNKRQNVIKGEFKRPGQIDWAILCARAGFV